ncbi:MAG TPA: DUF2017 family protein [Ilumatobacter sp.]|nr:DUF2017 family protein [Ilumatobacter sp.]
MSRFRAPIRRKGDGFIIDLGDQETEIVLRLVDELRTLLSSDTSDPATAAMMARLFPVAHPDDAEMEAEYQRLMREELVESKLSTLSHVEEALRGNGKVDEGKLLSFMQAVNSIRLVLGVMLGITDDESADALDDDLADGHEQALYHYLSWLLEWTVSVQFRP